MRRFAAFIVCLTLAGLAYVTAEVEAVKIGYTIRKQDEAKVQALDRLRALKYNIARLEAPHNLERRLLAQRIQLESPRQWQTLVMADPAGIRKHSLAQESLFQSPHFLGRLFVGTAQAEAKESGRS
ncbi:MAG: hypothetical protein COT00_03720 [Candidatus Omnitrophica bacterium CG07_land_8_20_14_0_80_50_8]|nr:MAG: hypothetical protein COT00_03720 [Candidatus Omnitrophica bacterium CG07_land_8_20_14_0_80_50_8]